MDLKTFNLESTRENLDASASRAAADIPALQAAHEAAQQKSINASADVERLKETYGSLQTKISVLTRRVIDAKRIMFNNIILERDDGGSSSTYHKLRRQKEDLISVLAHTVSYCQSDARTAQLEAQIEALEAQADLMEGLIVAQRLASARFGREASKYDPGVRLSQQADNPDGSVTKSWSQLELEKLGTLRVQKIPEVRLELQKHIEATDRERATVAGSLWS